MLFRNVEIFSQQKKAMPLSCSNSVADLQGQSGRFANLALLLFYSISIKLEGRTEFKHTPEPLYNTVRYNTVLNITRIRVGCQKAVQDSFSYSLCILLSLQHDLDS